MIRDYYSPALCRRRYEAARVIGDRYPARAWDALSARLWRASERCADHGVRAALRDRALDAASRGEMGSTSTEMYESWPDDLSDWRRLQARIELTA